MFFFLVCGNFVSKWCMRVCSCVGSLFGGAWVCYCLLCGLFVTCAVLFAGGCRDNVVEVCCVNCFVWISLRFCLRLSFSCVFAWFFSRGKFRKSRWLLVSNGVFFC